MNLRKARLPVRITIPVVLGLVFLFTLPAFGSGRQTLNFNPDWKFIKADPPRAFRPEFNDSSWTNVSAPHTFNDTDTFDDWVVPTHIGETNQWAGRTWYRKSFTLPESFKGKKIYIEFEAVRQVAEVYLNGRSEEHTSELQSRGLISY